MSIESVMPSNHLILCYPLLLLPSIFPSIRVFSRESVLCIRWPKYWKFSFSISRSNEYSGLISFSIANKGQFRQSYGFSSSHVWMWELDYKESWALKNWYFWTVVLEETLESPLDSKEIQSVHPKGNQSWIFIGSIDAEAETSILPATNIIFRLISDFFNLLIDAHLRRVLHSSPASALSTLSLPHHSPETLALFFFLIRDRLILLASLYCSHSLFKSSFCLASFLLFRFQI